MTCLPGASGEGHAVEVGSTVRVLDADGEHEYTIVSAATVDARPGAVSVGAPVGWALLGRRRGDEVEVRTPGGVRRLTVLAVTVPGLPCPPRSLRPCEA